MNKCRNFSDNKTAVFLILLFIVLAGGCRPKKEIKPVHEIPDYKPEEVIENFKNNQSEFDWFSARFAGMVNWENQKFDISGSIRIKKDEAIYISLSPMLGIEIARTIITPDSVKFLNRIESSYYKGHIGFINNFLQTSLDYDMLQAILVGNDFSNYTIGSFNTSEDNGLILLHDPKRKSLVNPPLQTSLPINQHLWIDPETHKIRKNSIAEKSTKHSIEAEYKEFENIEGELLPTKLSLMIFNPVKYADLSIKYLRVSLNEPQQMNFTVPSRYEPINFE